jgi:hypothetical protein
VHGKAGTLRGVPATKESFFKKTARFLPENIPSSGIDYNMLKFGIIRGV